MTRDYVDYVQDNLSSIKLSNCKCLARISIFYALFIYEVDSIYHQVDAIS